MSLVWSGVNNDEAGQRNGLMCMQYLDTLNA